MPYVIFMLLSIFLLPTSLMASEFYQWVDEEGVTHYTQTPPPSQIAAERRQLAPIDFPNPAETGESGEINTESSPDLEALRAARAKNCNNARENLARLNSAQEIVRLSSGEETLHEVMQLPVLSIEERQQEIERTRTFLDEFCVQQQD